MNTVYIMLRAFSSTFKMSFLRKRRKKEIIAVWLAEVIQDLKRCHDALKASTGKIDQLKDNVIILQKTKLQNVEQQIKVQNETVG